MTNLCSWPVGENCEILTWALELSDFFYINTCTLHMAVTHTLSFTVNISASGPLLHPEYQEIIPYFRLLHALFRATESLQEAIRESLVSAS